jgi:AbrB family looped-hinge helix DNA binding protein
METVIARISSKNQIVLPKEVREALGVHGGDSVIFLVDGNKAIIRSRPDSFTEAIAGLYEEIGAGQDWQQWLEKERALWQG